MEAHQVIRKPLLTEKGTELRDAQRKYIFEVDRKASKFQIKGAVESLFKVHVELVRTINIRGKIKRVGKNVGKQSNWKKAYVTIREGEKIEFFEGV